MLSIQTWRITPTQNRKIDLAASSLDEVTRQLPEGYYSTFRTFAGRTRVLGLSAHLRRLYEPVPSPDVDAGFLRRQLRALLELYSAAEARVRAVMTGQGQVYVAIEPLKPLPPEVYAIGVRVESTELRREHPRLKSTGFIGRSDAERKHIAQQGIFEALLVKDGKILEGMTSNFFYIAGQETRLCTAGDDILLGVTRATVIEIARGRGLSVEYTPLQRDQTATALEAFITSSTRGIVPVVQIDDLQVAEGRPGPITRELMDAYQAYVVDNSEEI